jgi:hypothetical protein
MLLIGSEFAFADSRQDAEIGWTLSASDTDPLDNFGPATSDTLSLYLWLWCSRPDMEGVSTANFALGTPGLTVHSFEASPGVTDLSPKSPGSFDLTFANCPPGSFLVGRLRVQNIAGSYEVCLGSEFQPDSSTGCASPSTAVENAFIGYGAGFSPPCMTEPSFFDGFCEPAVSVADESWSRVKAWYR